MSVSVNQTSYDPSSSESDDAAIQKYVDHVTELFKEADELIDLMEQNASQVTADKSQLAAVQQLIDRLHAGGFLSDKDYKNFKFSDYGTFSEAMNALADMLGCHGKGVKPSDVRSEQKLLRTEGKAFAPAFDSVVADLHKRETAIDDAEKKLEQIDPEMKELDASVDEIMNMFASNTHAGDFRSQDLKDITQYFQPLFKAMREKLETDKAEKMIQDAKNKNVPLSDSMLAKLYAQAVRGELAEQSTLNGMEMNLMKDSEAWYDTQNHADASLGKYSWYHALKSFGLDQSKKKQLRHIRSNAKMMQGLLREVLKKISPAMASLTPGFQEIQMVMDMLVEDVKKILAKKDLSPAAKKKQIQMVMMLALSLLSMILAQVTKGKAQLDKQCAKAVQESLLENIDHTKSQTERIINLKHAAKEMKKFLTITKWVMTAIFLLLAPGPLGLLAMGLVATLDATGQTEKGVNKMAQCHWLSKGEAKFLRKMVPKQYRYLVDAMANGKVGHTQAAIFMGLAEAAFVSGASAAQDAGSEKLAVDALGATATEMTEAAMEATIAEVMAQQLEETAVQEFTEQEWNTVQETLGNWQKETKAAMQAANEKVSKVLANQTMAGLARRVTEKGLLGAQKEAMEEVMVEQRIALQEAMAQALKPGEASTVQFGSATQVNAEAQGTRAASKTLDMDSEKVDAAGMSKTKVGSVITFYMAQNNVIAQELINMAKGMGAKDNTHAMDVIRIIAQIVQAMSGAGAAYAAFMPSQMEESMPLWMNRMIGGTMSASLGTQMWAQMKTAEIQEQMARAVPKVASSQANTDAFQFLLQRLFNEQKHEQEEWIGKEEAVSQSNYQMSLNLSHNDDVSRILSSAV